MKYRHEYKYMIDARQEAILRVKAAGFLMHDVHASQEGGYTVRSLYFDDINDTCLKDNLRGANPRSKFRIRYYDENLNHIMLEKKTKIHGMTLKESCTISVDECRQLQIGQIPNYSKSADKIKCKLYTELRMRALYPKVIVTYERIPFVYPTGNVRVTFDRKLSSSIEIERFLSQDYMMRPVFEKGKSILEVKWSEVMPRHIKDALQLSGLTWTACSKYYLCRIFHL